MSENKKCISMWLDNDLVDRIDKHKIDRRFPTRKYLIDSVLRTYTNHVEIEEGKKCVSMDTPSRVVRSLKR